MKIKLTKHQNHGRTQWVVDMRALGYGRKFFDSGPEAKEFHEVKQREVLALGIAALDLSHEDRLEIMAARNLLKVKSKNSVVRARVSAELKARLEAYCAFRDHRDQSDVIRDALLDYLAKEEKRLGLDSPIQYSLRKTAENHGSEIGEKSIEQSPSHFSLNEPHGN